jgi:hypothetical protein
LYLLSQTVFKVPVEAYENSAYLRVANGLRNPRRVRDAFLRIVFLTMAVVLLPPTLFVYVNLRLAVFLLTYSLIVLTTVVLYLLACDPLPPCTGKVTEWWRAMVGSNVAEEEKRPVGARLDADQPLSPLGWRIRTCSMVGRNGTKRGRSS